MESSILHILSQRPLLTGSGITLDALVRLAGRAGWRQAAMVGIPADDSQAQVGGLDPADIFPVRFAPAVDHDPAGAEPGPDLDFAVPGMSDVMPYPSSVWSRLTPAQLDSYRQIWLDRCNGIIARLQPDLIHTNHVWLMSGLIKEVAGHRPVVTTCHATGLRQLELCPHLAAEVIRGCRRNDHFCVLREDHRALLAETLDIPQERITVTGAGYRTDLFHPPPTKALARRDNLLFVGKYSRAKGLPWLLESFTKLAKKKPRARLHIVGGGTGPEAEALARTIADLAPSVVPHGTLAQSDLADLMRRCAVCVLPSFYEGVPLVLVEAAACGCRLVATDLPGIREQIHPRLGDLLTLVKTPRLVGVDQPTAADLPGFVEALSGALLKALDSPPAATPGPDLAHFTWENVFNRVQRIWTRLLQED